MVHVLGTSHGFLTLPWLTKQLKICFLYLPSEWYIVEFCFNCSWQRLGRRNTGLSNRWPSVADFRYLWTLNLEVFNYMYLIVTGIDLQTYHMTTRPSTTVMRCSQFCLTAASQTITSLCSFWHLSLSLEDCMGLYVGEKERMYRKPWQISLLFLECSTVKLWSSPRRHRACFLASRMYMFHLKPCEEQLLRKGTK